MKKFKLESSYNEYSDDLSFIAEEKVKYYIYVGSDIKTHFDERIKEIVLGFYKNILFYILYGLDDSILPRTQVFVEKLQSLFGDGMFNRNQKIGDMNLMISHIWNTKKVHLQFDRIKTDLVDDYSVKLHMHSLIIEEQIKMDDF